jgi:chromosome partitioning protein
MTALSVMVTNAKGGCGKSTLATNLATAFAAGGLRTALAEVDRQKSVLQWLDRRPASASSIQGLDWRKDVGDVPGGIQRLVIDGQAAMRLGQVDELLEVADIVVVPLLPSVFDEGSTTRFLDRLAELKPIRKQRKDVLLVANRLRARSKALQRLESFVAELGFPLAARISDRSLYAELALQGRGVFDAGSGASAAVRAEWAPLLHRIEALAG